MSSSLYHPRPILTQSHSQPASTTADYSAVRASYHPDASRLPLRESTGNTPIHTQQPTFHPHVPSSSSYPSPAGILSPAGSMQHQLPPPPSAAVVPSQSFDCLRGIDRPPPPQRFGGVAKRRGQGINPLYFWPQFRQYRNRQAHKDTQKDKGGVWRRPELEDAFVDCKCEPTFDEARLTKQPFC